MSARSPTPALTLNESPGTTRPDVLPEDLIAVNPALDFSFDVTHVEASCLACLLEERDAYGLCLFVCFFLNRITKSTPPKKTLLQKKYSYFWEHG